MLKCKNDIQRSKAGSIRGTCHGMKGLRIFFFERLVFFFYSSRFSVSFKAICVFFEAVNEYRNRRAMWAFAT